MILDHSSLSWGRDGSLDVGSLEAPENADEVEIGPLPNEQPEMDVTAQWCLATQTLEYHSKGVLWRGKHGARYSLINCHLSNNAERNPAFGHIADAVAVGDPAGCFMEAIGNAVYNWKDQNAGYMLSPSPALRLQFLNNYYKTGWDTIGFSMAFNLEVSPVLYVFGNEWNGIPWSPTSEYLRNPSRGTYRNQRFISHATPTGSASGNIGQINLHAGASRDRDQIDTKLLADFMAPGLGGVSAGGIFHQVDPALWSVLLPDATGPADDDNDGMPNVWELRHAVPFEAGASTDLLPWRDADGDGWTNLEEYLNGTSPRFANDPMREQSSEVSGDLSLK